MWKRSLIALLTIFEIIGHPGGHILILCDAGRHRSVAFAAFVMFMLDGVTREQAVHRAIGMRNRDLAVARRGMGLPGTGRRAKGTQQWYAPVCGNCRSIIAETPQSPLCPFCDWEAPFA